MKKLTIAIVLLIILLLLFFIWKNNTPKSFLEIASRVQTAKGGQLEAGVQQETHSPNMESGPTSSQEIKKHIRSLAYQPIEFYGKLVDQFGNPVAGAEITGSVLAGDGVSTSKTTTDGGGQFQFKGLKGMDLGIMAHKSGYEFVAKNTSFVYALFRPEKVHKPDPNKPVVFKMWKLAGPESMVHLDRKTLYIPYDGTSANIDLLTGKKVAQGGDLKLTLRRTPLKIQRGRQKYGWTVTIESIGGGLIESKDEFMFLAPEQGYVPQIKVDMPNDDPNWSSSIQKTFYLKSRDGKIFGRVNLGIWSDSDDVDTGIIVEAWLNPKGSRNLEWDPSKELTKDDIAKLGFANTNKQ